MLAFGTSHHAVRKSMERVMRGAEALGTTAPAELLVGSQYQLAR